jgi:hypothetical protein
MSDAKQNDAEWLTARTFSLLLGATIFLIFPQVALGFHSFFYRDFGALGYPCGIFTRDSLLRGELPLWNPYSHCGVPWLAQMGQWYPVSWLCLLLPLPWAVNFSMLAHLWFGGFGMFWLLRRWHFKNFAAAFGAFAFVFNGVTLSCLEWGNYIASLAWLPWVVGCTTESWRAGGRWIVLAALASALQVLTATPEITLLTWIFLGAIWLGEISSREIKFFASAKRILLVVSLAAGITMIQMLPFFDLITHSQRSAGNVNDTVWSMPGWGWANLIVPRFHCYQAPQGPWFQHEQEFLASYYLGAGVLTLAIGGAMLARNRILLVTTAMILFCWIMALGLNGFFYGQFKKIFPLVGIARFPVKFTILTALLVPLLAAAGIERLQASQNKNARRLFAIIAGIILFFMAILLWFARQFPLPLDNWNATATNTLCRATLMIALIAGVCGLTKIKNRAARIAMQLFVLAVPPLDAMTHSPKIAPTLPASVLASGMWQASGHPSLKFGDGRIMVTPDAEQQLLYSRVADLKTDFLGKRLAEWYNLNLLDSVPKVTGAVTLRPACFDVLEKYLYYTAGGHCGRGLVDFLSVAWLTSPDNPTQWIARTNFLPLLTAGQKPVFAGDEKILSAITANDFDPRAIVYLPESEKPFITVTKQTNCEIRNSNFRLNEIEADANAGAPSLIVISQSYYHLWRAFVDEKPVPLLRANLAFQAVEIPAGTHHVKLIYHDPYLKIGAAVSAIALIFRGWLWFRQNPLTRSGSTDNLKT